MTVERALMASPPSRATGSGVQPDCRVRPSLRVASRRPGERVARTRDTGLTHPAAAISLLGLGGARPEPGRAGDAPCCTARQAPLVVEQRGGGRTSPSSAYAYYVPKEAALAPPQRVRAAHLTR